MAHEVLNMIKKMSFENTPNYFKLLTEYAGSCPTLREVHNNLLHVSVNIYFQTAPTSEKMA